jgi:predicted deacylase
MTDDDVEIPRIRLADFDANELCSGTRCRYWLEIGESLVGSVALPALVVKGAPGRTLVVIAGVHGDEYEGMEAIRQTYGRLEPSSMSGTFIGIPVANPFAYAARMRATPERVDGLNLARVFPGDTMGTPTRALAALLLDFVERTVGLEDLFVDLHSGSADVEFASMVGFRSVENEARSAAEEAARYFGIHRLWQIPDSLGPFNAETARRNIPTLGTETTGRAGCQAEDVAGYAQGIRNLLHYLRIVASGSPLMRFAGDAAQTIDVLATTSGFYRGPAELNRRVELGEPLGVIVDLFGEVLDHVTSPARGTIWARRSMPPVHAGELLHMIARDEPDREQSR